MVMPPNLDTLDPALSEVQKNIAKWTTNWQDRVRASKRYYENMADVGRWMGKENNVSEPTTVLSIISHHTSAGSIHFTNARNDYPLRASEIALQFSSPSIAILNGCGTGTAGSEEFVRVLNSHGFEAIVATNTTISGKMAAHYLNCLAKQIDEHSQSPLTIREAHYGALRCLYHGDALATDGVSYGAKTLWYSLLGNTQLLICPPEKE